MSRILKRLKLSRMRDLEPRPVFPRYEHAAAGDLLHLDIKRLARIARPSHRVTGNRRDRVSGIGVEFVHVAIDDTRVSLSSAIYPDETRALVLDFLDRAPAYYERLGIRFKAVLTDNGVSYRPMPSPTAVVNSGSSTVAPGPTHCAPTARPNASSRSRCANGPMPHLPELNRARAKPRLLDTPVQLAQTAG